MTNWPVFGRIWTATVNGKANGLAAANGRLFISTDTGSIYAFGCIQGDFDCNGNVDAKDLLRFAETYLNCTNPANPIDCDDQSVP